jgi:hypothetical protein
MPMLRIFLALWLAFTPAFAWAGSMSLMGVGTAPGASLPPVTLTFQANGLSSASASTETFSITFLSALAASQRVAVFYNSQSFFTSGPIVTAVFTPNIGSPVFALFTDAGNDTALNFHSVCLSALMPTGATSVTLTVTYSSTIFSSSSYGVYTLNDTALVSSTPTFIPPQQGTTSPLSASIATPAGSGLVGSFFSFGVTSGQAWSAGLTSDTGGVNFSNDFGHISNATASGSYATSYVWTSGPGNPDLTLWVYR